MPVLLLAAFLFGALAHAEIMPVWEKEPNYRRMRTVPMEHGKTGFTMMFSVQTGILFSNLLSIDRACTNSILANGSGVALGDVDGDGWCDLYFASLDGRNALYRNLGNWKFEDITLASGLRCEGMICTGVVLADVDGDGDLDLLVNALFGGTKIFLNDGHAHFSDATRRFAIASTAPATSMALADIDGDGDLDLYVANYRNTTVRDEPGTHFDIKRQGQDASIRAVNGTSVTNSALANRFYFDALEGVVENGEADVLYVNEGDHFRAVSWTEGAFLDEGGRPAETPYDWGLSVMMRDLNGDGAPDIYVCNDFVSPDRIWINQGNGKFRALSPIALRDTSHFSMGVDVADINRDGHDDIFVLDMFNRDHRIRQHQIVPKKRQIESENLAFRAQQTRNTLQLSRGDGSYAEIALLAGVHASDWSWTPLFLDVDLDGYEDILISNGFIYDGQNLDIGNEAETISKSRKPSRLEHLRLRQMFPKLDATTCAFRNMGDLTFEDRAREWNFQFKGVSQGMALADLDNDGDLDVIINTLNSPAVVYRNDSPAPRIGVRLKGAAKNTRGIGARITVTGGPVMQSQEIISGGRYLSSDDATRTFAAGSTTNSLRITVRWRSGRETVVENAEAGWIYEIEEAPGSAPPQQPQPKSAEVRPLFVDATTSLKHVHLENAFNDFDIQPLVPRKLSQNGPGVAVIGNSVFAIGGTRGGKLAIFSPKTNSTFSKREVPVEGSLKGDTQGMVYLADEQGGRLLVALSSWEQVVPFSIMEVSIRRTNISVSTNSPALPCTPGPLAAADIDGDADLDLFVGGRAAPGRYPEPCSSFVLRRTGTAWSLDEKLSLPFKDVGMVSGAVFSDLNGDGWPDLALACDWGPVRVFMNEHGVLRESTGAWGLSDYRGCWNGIATGDFNADGRIDLVVSNWGRNTKYQPYLKDELRLYFGEWQMTGRLDCVEGYLEPLEKKTVVWADYTRAIQALPFLAARFPRATDFAAASVEDLLAEKIAATRQLRVNTMDSMIFLNCGDHFEGRSLPVEAQFAPAFGITVADFDCDGADDIFLAQNFFGTDANTGRYASGRSLLLLGNGRGDFRAAAGQESGLRAYGEQRGTATGDFNADGRPDLILCQNNGPTRLFLNNGSRSGLRVRFEGGAPNPRAVGTIWRGVYKKNQFGPAREIHAGTGYWSQDGPVQILSNREDIEEIWVRWPGGETNCFNVPQKADEVVVTKSGVLVRTLPAPNVAQTERPHP